jgi:hypothetical protein
VRGAEILANVTRQDELNRDGRTTACRLLRWCSGRVEPSIFEASSFTSYIRNPPSRAVTPDRLQLNPMKRR